MDSSGNIVDSNGTALGTEANKIEEVAVADVQVTTENKLCWKRRLAAFSGTFFEW